MVGGLRLVGLGLFGGCGTGSGDVKLSATDINAAIGDGPPAEPCNNNEQAFLFIYLFFFCGFIQLHRDA